jgi:hypothetical protein
MDAADISSEMTDVANQQALEAFRARVDMRTKLFPITGICYNENCGEDSKDRPFCSAACRDEYDRLKKLRGR